jgi:Lon protease-like protein
LRLKDFTVKLAKLIAKDAKESTILKAELAPRQIPIPRRRRTIEEFFRFRGRPGVFVSLLPLFPLDLVLFPGTPLPLHIFEPRYREMISECLEQKISFGVVRAKEEGVAEIGCTAEIITVAKKYPDGRMDITTEGRERFEVMQINQERPFLRAEVLYLQDEPEKPTQEEIARAVKLQGEIVALAGSGPADPSANEDSQLSFNLVAPLPLDLDFKQTLLGMKSEAERMQAVITYLEAILPNLRRTVRVRQKASGNGHAH